LLGHGDKNGSFGVVAVRLDVVFITALSMWDDASVTHAAMVQQ
jgi:hypothetical protein